MTTSSHIRSRTLAMRRASLGDLWEIVTIERDSFPSPWPTWGLRRELERDEALYLVAERDGAVVGYAGMWRAADEAHVGTLAVAPEQRRQGIGEALMLALLQIAADDGVRLVHLEYRVGNAAAAALYAKLGFRATRIRRGYYADTGEDAVETMLDDLGTSRRRAALARVRQEWERRHGESFLVGQ